MKTFLVLAASLSLCSSAPQFINTQNEVGPNCHTQVETVFEETESETVNKVICETEFRDSCITRLDTVCRNITTSTVECRIHENFVCEDNMTEKCGVEQVLKNVSYTETVCRQVEQDICEMETVGGGVSRPVEGSCVSKTVEECAPETRFQEEFVEEEVCRDIPIKDCKTVEEEICENKVEEECEEVETQECDIVPHEECKQIVDKIPKKVSKKVTKVVCDDKMNMENEPTNTLQDDEDDVPSLQDILEIFGVNTNDNDVNIDDAFQSTTTTTTAVPTTTTTTTTTTTKSSTTERELITTTTSLEFDASTTSSVIRKDIKTPSSVRRTDGSQIIFSDDAIDSRIKELATRGGPAGGVTTSRPVQNTETRKQLPNSQIFFPE